MAHFDRTVELSFEEGIFSSLPVAFLWLLYYFLSESTSKAVYLVDVFVDSEPVIWVLSQFNVPKGGKQRLRLCICIVFTCILTATAVLVN